ncbi:hypothetical protein BH09SUM1_BH09SUM1_24770 [soil metagenome]
MRTIQSTLRLAVATALILLTGLASADVIVLKNGGRITGSILKEDEKSYSINTGASELSIDKATVASVERGAATDYIISRGKKALKSAEEGLQKGDKAGATKIVDRMIAEIDQVIAKTPDSAKDLQELRGQLDDVRRRSLPTGPGPQEAERLFQDAALSLDHVNYAEAFASLKKAVEADPQRADIMFKLGSVAEKVGDQQASIDAYRSVLKLNAETYYEQVSKPLLAQLRQRGVRLLNERRPDAAVEVYSEILLLRGASDAEPANMADFLARRTTRGAQSEEQTLMEVYKYADDADLVDLAFAAATKVQRINPAHEGIGDIIEQTGFLAKFRQAMDSRNVEEAAKLIAAAKPGVLAAPSVAGRLEKFSGELGPAVRAQAKLEEAKAAFKIGDYDAAAIAAKAVLVDFPAEESAKEATGLLASAIFESPIKSAIAAATKAVDGGNDDQADAILASLKTNTPKLEESVQYPAIQSLLNVIPLQQRADELWSLAAAEMDREDFAAATTRLEELERGYAMTRAGKKASEWLRNHRDALARQAQRYKPAETDYFAAWTDPTYWRSAAIPDASQGRLRIPPVVPEARTSAMKAFDQVMSADLALKVEGRSQLLHIAAPLLSGGIMLIGLLWAFARPGSGQLRDTEAVDESVAQASTSGVHSSKGHCRACGQLTAAHELACPACGTPANLSVDEKIRESDDQRRADYDPWAARVKAQDLNQFEKYYQKARDLSETSDLQAAIEACRQALREDPHSIRGYTLLAGLHERIGQSDQAIVCYRELLLLEPGEAMVRQKLDSLMKAPPLRLGPCAYLIAAPLWWTILFLAAGATHGFFLAQAGLCILGFALTIPLLHSMQRRSKITCDAHDVQPPVDVQRPLPVEDLSWAGQSRQARILADAIRHHTGIEVPAMTVGRFFTALFLSFTLLAVVVALAWVNRAPWALLAWPSGTILFVYLIEIYPRLYTAHVLLRHLSEEALSPWSDPHRPFLPKGVNPPPTGEFLALGLDTLPLRWAMKPQPYRNGRQGILNSLQQTLNRHWSFHAFYDSARIVRSIEMPQPAGHGLAKASMILLLIAALVSCIALLVNSQGAVASYREDMTLGYQYLLEGDVDNATPYFYKAMLIDGERIAPRLYLGHAFAEAALPVGAERAFRAALARKGGGAATANDYGNFLQRQGRLREAVVQYEAALVFDPENPDILSNAGSACFKLKEYSRAIEFLKRATTARPAHDRAWVTLGIALKETGDLAGAKEAYQKAVAVAPNVDYTRVAKDRLASDLAPDESKSLRLNAPVP